jgi:(1->4)-alpha-D-glucan 1-alpha-D-glucosylmutase
LSSFLPFQERIAKLGVHNSLVQTTLKLTAPGVPDVYQGADLWDLSLVDPDNRRPVDYQQRVRALAEIADGPMGAHDLLTDWKSGAIKLFVISRILALRTEQPDVFATGDYEVLRVVGPEADRVCAFARRAADQCIIVVAARFPARGEAIPLGRTLP